MQSKSEPITNQNLLPIQTDEFLPPISKWMTWGGLSLVGSCGIAIALAAFTPYKVTVKAAATIRPVGELRLVQSAIQGEVKQIAVTENQIVKQGDVIAMVNDSRLQMQKNQLQKNLSQNQQQLHQIDAQIVALEKQITAEKERMQRAVNFAQAELEEAQRDYQNQKITSESQVQEAKANLRQAQRELQKTQTLLKSVQAELKSSEASLKASIARRDRYQPIAEQGALSQDQYQEAQVAVTQQEQTLESKKATVEAQKQEIKRLSSAVDASEARLKGALASLNPSNARIKMIQEKIGQEKAKGEVTLARLTQEQKQLLQNRSELQKQINTNQKELEQIKTEVADTVIHAPASGTIQQLNLRNIEQIINTGDQIAQIAPSESSLVVKAYVPSQEIAKVEIGQAVQMRVSACPYPDYGTLKGRVTAISPDVVTVPSENNNGVKPVTSEAKNLNYNVEIKPDHLELKSISRRCTLQVGMEGRADIITQEETFLTFILRKARLLSNI